MNSSLERQLRRWTDATLIDVGTADRIRSFELGQKRSSDWMVKIALLLGALMIGAGILLFVASHWDQMSPAQRFLLVIAMVAAFHVVAPFYDQGNPMLATTLHALGTVALGAGILLTGQIFNMQEHWPGAFMLWSLGALVAWLIRRDWIQGVFLAILAPIWLLGEWEVATEHLAGGDVVVALSTTLLALAYLTSCRIHPESYFRRGLQLLGAIALIPAAISIAYCTYYTYGRDGVLPLPMFVLGCVVALGAPLAVAYALRKRGAWMNALAIVPALIISRLDFHEVGQEMAIYALFALCAIGLIAWGVYEARPTVINVGVLGFAANLLGFYFSQVMDKLGRSVALIGFGVIFLIGGYELEKLRRTLISRIGTEGGSHEATL